MVRQKHHPDTLGVGDPRSASAGCARPTRRSWTSRRAMLVGLRCYDLQKGRTRRVPSRWRDPTGDLDRLHELLLDLAGDMMQRLRAPQEQSSTSGGARRSRLERIAAARRSGHSSCMGATAREDAGTHGATACKMGLRRASLTSRCPSMIHGGLHPEHQRQLSDERRPAPARGGRRSGDRHRHHRDRANYRCEATRRAHCSPARWSTW